MSRRSTKKIPADITRLIAHLERQHATGDLCADGRERLAWWKANGHRFKSVRAALATWTVPQVDAWFEYMGYQFDWAERLDPVRYNHDLCRLDGLPDWPDVQIKKAVALLNAYATRENAKRKTAKQRVRIMLDSAERLGP